MEVGFGNPGEWKLKAQGRANAVFTYTGSGEALIGKVLRVKKKLTKGAPKVEDFQRLEELVWAAVPGMLTRDEAAKEVAFFSDVMAPLLGNQFVQPPVPIQPSPELLSHLRSQLQLKNNSVEGELGPIALLQDNTLFHAPAEQPSNTQDNTAQSHALPCVENGQGGAGPVVCVEIKPKCGLLPAATALIRPEHGLKWLVPQYRLHQLLKLAQGKTSQLSAYNPMDLFSGDASSVRHALLALFADPQNNLQIFRDGAPLQLRTTDGAEPAGTNAESGSGKDEAVTLEEALEGLIPLPSGQRALVLAQLLHEVCEREGILRSVLAAQALDKIGIDGAHELLIRLLNTLSGPSAAPQHTSADAATCAVPSLSDSEAIQPHSSSTISMASADTGACRGRGAGVAQTSGGAEGNAPADHKSPAEASLDRESAEREDQPGSLHGGVPWQQYPVIVEQLKRFHSRHLQHHGGSILRGRHDVAALLRPLVPAVTTSQLAWAEAYRTAGERLRQLPIVEAHVALRDYLTAATAKDCSIMITLQRASSQEQCHISALHRHSSCENEVYDATLGAAFRYKVGIVDLDIKSLQKIPEHFLQAETISSLASGLTGSFNS